MRNLFLSIAISILIATNMYSQEFNLKEHKLNIEGKVISATYFNGNLYCLESDGKVFNIDSLCNIKYIANAPISSTSIISINDSLLVSTKNDSTFYFKENKFSFIKRNTNFPFFEDEKYIVERSCSGEWGGSIYFINKLNNKKYECTATCPIALNKINNSYVVTASLAHLVGFSQILKIDDPKDLTLFKKKKKEKNKLCRG